MKNFFTGLFLLPLLLTHAQDNKNKFVVTGNLAVSYRSQAPLGLGAFNIGYFPTTNFSMGFTGGLSNNVNRSSTDELPSHKTTFDQKRSSNFVGIFARYNFSAKNKFAFFLCLNNSFTWDKYKSNSSNVDINGVKNNFSTQNLSIGYTVSLNPGIIYFFHTKFSAELSLGSVWYSIQHTKETVTPPQTPTRNNISNISRTGASFFTTGFNIGVSYYFGCKNKNKEQ